MADITVNVQSPGSLSVWGQSSWGNGTWNIFNGSTLSSGNATVTAEINTGWGGKTWGESEWGDLSDSIPIISGQGLTTDIGSVTTTEEINEGWGRLTWGENAWGAAGDVVVTGQSLSTSVGSVTSKFGSSVIPTGQSLTVGQGTVSIEIIAEVPLTGQSVTASIGTTSEIAGDAIVNVTGISLNSNVGSVSIDPNFLIEQGWGRGTWGNRVWGGAYTVIAQGQSLTTAQGTAVGKTDVDVSVTGLDLLTITQGLSSIQIDNDVFVFASEDQLDLSLGNQSLEQSTNESVSGQSMSSSVGQVIPEPKIPVDVTGISATLTLGTITLIQTTNESVTGQAVTSSIGQVTQETAYPVTTAGLMTTSAGSVTATGGAASVVTGIGLTTNIGSVTVTPWSEINPGVNNVWSEVDKAA